MRHGGPPKKIVDFTKLFWANRGNHNDMTAQKFLPEFTFEELKTAAHAALAAGGFKGTPYGTPAIRNQADLDKELDALRPSLFDPNFQPMITAKSPQGSLDILQASANNFYSGVSMADLKDFHDAHPLNSRLVKHGRQAGGGDLSRRNARRQNPAGPVRASSCGRRTSIWRRRRRMPSPARSRSSRALIRYYQTGDPADWIQFGIAWVRTTRRSISPTASSRSIATRARRRGRRRASSASPTRS